MKFGNLIKLTIILDTIEPQKVIYDNFSHIIPPNKIRPNYSNPIVIIQDWFHLPQIRLLVNNQRNALKQCRGIES